MKGRVSFWIEILFLSNILLFAIPQVSLSAESSEPASRSSRSHESAGVRTTASHCKQAISFRLLPRGTNGKLQWEVVELDRKQRFRIIVAEPYVDAEPIFDEIVEVDSVGVQTHALSQELADKQYRYTVQVICNPAEPSNSVAASGLLYQNQLFSTDPLEKDP